MPKVSLEMDVIEAQLQAGQRADGPCQNCGEASKPRVYVRPYVLCDSCLHTELEALAKGWGKKVTVISV